MKQFVTDVRDLLQGFRNLVEEDHRFLQGGLVLPSGPGADFKLSRDLFSVGFDEVGLLIAGRGLEGVLREIARQKGILLERKGDKDLVAEADTHDLIEALYRVRWAKTKERLITKVTKTLLHYLRTLRNTGAHSQIGTRAAPIRPRETAVLIAGIAMKTWTDTQRPRARFAPKVVKKTW